ncbi:MAG: hypothetical protein NTZ50_12915 [Chloroflexi bacterium]|nr:hypothetical protein [Chloroflexota bacterium]
MERSRNLTIRLAALGLGAVLALSACTPAQPAVKPPTRPTRPTLFALPRIEVAFDRDGIPTIAGISARLVERLTFGLLPARAVQLDRAWIDYFASTDVQHIELLQNEDGMFAWINGRRLPNIAYGSRELDNSTRIAEQLGVLETLGISSNAASFLRRITPLLRHVALNVLVRFPLHTGTATIAPRDPHQAVHALPRLPKTDATRALDIALRYDMQGDPWPQGISDEQFTTQIGFDIMRLALQPAFVARISSRGLRDLVIRSEADGISLKVNNVALPALQCDARCLTDLGDIIATLNTYPQTEHLNAPIRALTPSLSGINAKFALHFPSPVTAGAARLTNLP